MVGYGRAALPIEMSSDVFEYPGQGGADYAIPSCKPRTSPDNEPDPLR